MTKQTAPEGKEEHDGIWIASTRTAPGSDLPSACLITWNDRRWYASVEDVRATALDLIACAAWADVMLAMISLGLPKEQLGGFFGDLLHKTRQGRPFGTPSTFMLTPAGATRKKKRSGSPRPPERVAVVLLERDGETGNADSDTARVIAAKWLEVAGGVDQDRTVVAALRATGAPDGFEALLFGKMFELRTAGQG